MPGDHLVVAVVQSDIVKYTSDARPPLLRDCFLVAFGVFSRRRFQWIWDFSVYDAHALPTSLISLSWHYFHQFSATTQHSSNMAASRSGVVMMMVVFVADYTN